MYRTRNYTNIDNAKSGNTKTFIDNQASELIPKEEMQELILLENLDPP